MPLSQVLNKSIGEKMLQLIYRWENLHNLQSNGVEQIKKQNDGSPVSKEIITIKNGVPFSKELELRENDVYFFNLIKL